MIWFWLLGAVSVAVHGVVYFSGGDVPWIGQLSVYMLAFFYSIERAIKEGLKP